MPRASLTDAERTLVADLAHCYNQFSNISGSGSTRDADLSEIADKIHQLQAIVLAQAAGRIYPTQYRLIGEGLN